jgi:hypothetical protein
MYLLIIIFISCSWKSEQKVKSILTSNLSRHYMQKHPLIATNRSTERTKKRCKLIIYF